MGSISVIFRTRTSSTINKIQIEKMDGWANQDGFRLSLEENVL
jgi:hypothetical protein